MNSQVIKQRGYLFIFVSILMVTFGIQSIGYAQEANPTITASVEEPLTEANLHGSTITLTLNGRQFIGERDIEDALSVSGIEGVYPWGVERVSDTEAIVGLRFAGNIDTDATLTLTVGPNAIGYDKAFTFEFPVTAVAESLVATTEAPLTEATLNGSTIILTLTGRQFIWGYSDSDEVSVSGIDGVTIERVDRVSDTEVIVLLRFVGNIDTDATLTLTVGPNFISYDKAFTFEFPVTAVEESLVASTEAPLTEVNLHGSIITLTLTGRHFANSWDIKNAFANNWDIQNVLTISGIDGVSFDPRDVEFVSDTEVTVQLAFAGDFDTDATLTIEVGAGIIADYDGIALTAQLSVTAIEDSLIATTEFPLTEENLHGSIITLTLTGRRFANFWDIRHALTFSGIEGVTVSSFSDVNRVSDTEVSVRITFNGDFDTDATLTLTVGEDAIVVGEYANVDLTFNFPVTAVEQSDATVSISPTPIAFPGIGNKLTLNLDIANGKNVAGYQATVGYDPSVLRYTEGGNGNYLPADAFFADPILDYDWLGDPFSDDSNFIHRVTIAGNTLAETGNGDGTLATLTFEVLDYKPFTVTLVEVYLVDADGKRWEVTTKNGEVIEPPELTERIFGDLNLDGVVNIQDLVIVSNRFGRRGKDIADVSDDGLVNIVDLVLVAAAFGDGAAAPSLHPAELEVFTTADVQLWLSQAQHLNLTDARSQRGIRFLQQLLATLMPKKTALLPNYPNPFNPETWIPYHLAKNADVTVTIYNIDGQVVRSLMLGHQPAGMYQSRSRAAYWDGKNAFGETVASGVYFYTLTAGNFNATRKMLIRK